MPPFDRKLNFRLEDLKMPIKRLLLATTLISLSSSIFASPFAIYDARSAGMGGTGVASAHISSAPFFNPAMLASQRSEEDFSLLFGAGVSAQDSDKLITDLEDFDTAYSSNDVAAAQAAINSAVGKQLTIQGAGFLSFGVAFEEWAFAGSRNGYVQANIGIVEDIGNVLLSDIRFTGAEVTEAGVSIAKNFGDFSIGLTPKTLDVTSYDQSADIANNSAVGDIIDVATTTGKKTHGSSANIDVGAVYKVTENWKVGAVMRNVLSETYTTAQNNTVSFKPQTRVGLAYTGDIITLSADYDLVKNDSIVTGGEKTQYLNTGAEIDLFDFN